MAEIKNLSQLLADWSSAKGDIEQYVKRIPDVMGMTAVEVCKDNFRLQGYDDGNSIKRWPKREDSTNRRYNLRNGVKGTVYNAAAKILHQSGDLMDAISHKVRGNNNVFIGVDEDIIPYAQIHNEGLKGLAFGKTPFQMPQRQFMPLASEGANPKMIKKINAKVNKDLARIMKNFITR